MNYPRSNRNQEKRFKIFLLAILIVLSFFYQYKIIFGFFGGIPALAAPLLGASKNVKEGVGEGILSLFSFKSSLIAENEGLKNKLSDFETKLLENERLLAENAELKAMLGRTEKEKLLLANVLSKPNQSPYDTLILDVGENYKVAVGDKVFASGNTLIGEIREAGKNTSKAVLFSSPGEEYDGVIVGKNISLRLTGHGGGNFIAELPRGVSIDRGDQVVSVGNFPRLLGVVDSIFSDPRDPFQSILLKSPINMQGLRLVGITVHR